MDYENEMYDFLVQEENMKGLIIAKNQFDLVKRRLLMEFWQNVADQLKEQLPDNYKDRWTVVLEDDIFVWHSKLYLKDNSLHDLMPNGLPSFMFGWERLTTDYPYYVFWINEESALYRKAEIKDYLFENRNTIAPGFDCEKTWWLYWKGDLEFKGTNDNDLLKIIPSIRDSKAKDYAERLISFFVKMQPTYEHILQTFKEY